MLLALVPFRAASAQAELDPEQLRPGVVLQIRDATGRRVLRHEHHLRWNEMPSRVDPRLGRGPWQLEFQAVVQVLEPGTYRFFAQADHLERFVLDGKTLSLERTGPRWYQGKEVSLRFGFHRLEVRLRMDAGGNTGVFWQGPRWPVEPIPPARLFHEHRPRLSWFQEGALLARAFRCRACHRGTNESAGELPAPALDQVATNYRFGWLVEHLSGEGRETPAGKQPSTGEEEPEDDEELGPFAPGPRWWALRYQPGRRMPHFGLSVRQAEAVAAYLWSVSSGRRTGKAEKQSRGTAPASNPRPAAAKKLRQPSKNRKRRGRKPSPPSARQGQQLFLTLGCLACHGYQGQGHRGLFSGGELDQVAAKRPAGFFARWLQDPQSCNAQARMPRYELSPTERQSLVLFLQQQRGGSPAPKDAAPARFSPEQVEQGRRLVQRYRCGACHRLPEATPPPEPLAPLGTRSRWDQGCLGSPNVQRARPGYLLPLEARRRIRHYFEQSDLQQREAEPGSGRTVQASAAPAQLRAGADASGGFSPGRGLEPGWLLLVERNCVGCHARDRFQGIEPVAQRVAADHAELAPLLPAMKPPALLSVGDKLTDAALAEAIAGRKRPTRPWLAVRMPRFALSSQEQQRLAAYLKGKDRVPPQAPGPAVSLAGVSQQQLLAAGARLVTGSGFGCTSCHQIGPIEPGQVELKSRGPDLALLGRRVRRGWYWRWMPNPSRIVPRMEMPALVSPVPGVLEGDLARQLEAVWQVLNRPGFRPPKPDPVRVVRRHNDPARPDEPAVVLTDVVELDPQGRTAFVKPLLVGLPNRHNVLLDLATGELAAWWVGEVAYQRTRGKTWYWEPGSVPLWPVRPESLRPPFAIRYRDHIWLPARRGQFVTEVDAWEHTGGGVRFRYRLVFTPQGKPLLPDAPLPPDALLVRATETWQPLPGKMRPFGWQRVLRLQGLPAPAELLFRPASVSWKWSAVSRGNEPVLLGRREGCQVEVHHTGRKDHAQVGSWRVQEEQLALAIRRPGPVEVKLSYRTDFAADRHVQPEPPVVRSKPRVLADVLPGFVGHRLPLPVELMPTGLAWDARGRLLVASLKGRVWLVEDRDGDGLPESARVFSDELAAPYGLHVGPQGVDVINKYALLRLVDRNGDGRADQVHTLASGWGHTRDYHDWAVGLPRDTQGRYYISLACQQDQRSAEAARWRGTVLRLVPRSPTPEDPRLFRPEVLARGFRFPMGMAFDAHGRLFVTDNQGNYTPFNELNHVLSGRWYGFPNQIERRPGAKFPPVEEPAVAIPHPWTRSVNGLCLLQTPAALRKTHPAVFGPYEGHLVGCEYNLQRLVRFTLEEVQGVVQGAVYPFSLPAPAESDPPLLGPIVCAVSPQGELVVGNMRDSAWGGGNNQGTVVVFRPRGDWPCGLARVEALPNGFRLRFTAPVDPRLARRPESYQVWSFRRVRTPAYGGEDVDRRQEPIRRVELAPDGRSVRLYLALLREGFVYEFHLSGMAPEGKPFFPAEAYYTLRRIPKR